MMILAPRACPPSFRTLNVLKVSLRTGRFLDNYFYAIMIQNNGFIQEVAMTTLSIQQAVFLISTLRQQLNREMQKFHSEYRTPIAVNSKSIVTDEKSQKVFDSLQKMDQLKHDIVTLKTAIHLKNSTSEIEAGVTASDMLEQLKLERKMIEELQSYTTFGYGQERIKTVAGVGVVEEGIIEEDRVNAYIEELEAAANAKSMKVDQFNSTMMIEVELLTA